MELDIPGEDNGFTAGSKENELHLRPVKAGESGEGLPYAPVDWPNRGDNWTWKVGKRKTSSGFWIDRYLYPPRSLRKTMTLCRKYRFASRYSVEQYIRKEFPNADVNAFFASFSWKVPSEDSTWTKDESNSLGMLPDEEMAEHSGYDSNHESMDCKARNRICNLQLQARTYSLASMDCDICCSEPGFCRNCCCILCCKTINWAYGGYSFVKCEARVGDNYICGHVAHMDCALRSYMAGTVGGSIGLDVEYYCRRCDKRTSLIPYVTRLVMTCESLDSRDDIEKILNLGLCIVYGSQQTDAKKLLHRIGLAMTKLKCGADLKDIWKEENASPVSTEDANDEDIPDFRTDLELPLDLELQKQSQPPMFITSDHRIASVKLQDKIDQVLQSLKRSQEFEYRIAEERLYAQKDFLLGLYQQLDTSRAHLAKCTGTATNSDSDALLGNVINRVGQIKLELEKLTTMKEVAKGFGRASKTILREHFGLDIQD
ncbi:PREDICTED: uncharacterized protein LOC104598606 isoform X3 [Nelumbo nucifera]|uniref:Uncharacterized protein LOC104598606 isoform X3 n=1 Tax=Nelumbo nucifera TaxID=4432 RepID=A0A1U7ZX33_NELNU|nr:PREDICTED: uncharacterized protein LOC104598606 isoform X3 [Nelumbo nucifera]